MSVLLRFLTLAIVMLFVIMSEISSLQASPTLYEPYLLEELEPNQVNKENIHKVNFFIDYEDEEDKMRNYLNTLRDTRHRWEKRNGDLINYLLGLPKGMLDAGR